MEDVRLISHMKDVFDHQQILFVAHFPSACWTSNTLLTICSISSSILSEALGWPKDVLWVGAKTWCLTSPHQTWYCYQELTPPSGEALCPSQVEVSCQAVGHCSQSVFDPSSSSSSPVLQSLTSSSWPRDGGRQLLQEGCPLFILKSPRIQGRRPRMVQGKKVPVELTPDEEE